MTFNLSYEFQNKVRQLGDVFRTVVEQSPTTSRLLTVSNDPFRSIKLERLQDTTKKVTFPVATAYTAWDTNLVVTSTAWMKPWMILQFELPSGARATVQLKVVSITNGTTAVVEVYWATTDVNLWVWSIASLLDLPGLESSDAQNGDGEEPTTRFNTIQLIEEFANVSYTSLGTDIYGINRTPWEVLNYQVEKKLQQIAYKVGASSINMARVERDSTERGTMWWRLRYMKNTAWVADVAWWGNAVDSALLNEAFEELKSNWAENSFTIVAHPVQAKRFKAINQNNIRIVRDDTTAGSFVENFVTDFGDEADIVYSYDMDKDKVAIVDPRNHILRPFINDAFRDEDATLPGSRNIRRRIHGQYSLEVRNVETESAIISNLAI